MKSGDEKDYIRLVCAICRNKNNCDKTQIKIHNYGDKLNMKCIEYKYENSPLETVI